MGIFSGKAVTDENGNKQCCMLCWGKVVSDAQASLTNKKQLPKVNFTVRYGKKGDPNNGFMNVSSVGDCQQSAIASQLESGDYVLIAGTWEEHKYKIKSGEEKTYSCINIGDRWNGFISIMGATSSTPEKMEEPDGPVATSIGSWPPVSEDGEEDYLDF